MTKEEIIKIMRAKALQSTHDWMSPAQYLDKCVDAMFETAAVILADKETT